jgi:hypothetical protein
MPWIDSVASVLEAWYPGQQDGDAIAALLFGDVDPSGKLPVTFPHNLSQVPASGVDRWPGVASARYSEGLDVGYRWYDAKAVAPLFPFGFGLTYTSFTFDHLTVTPSPTGGAPFTVSVDVTNAGHRQGSDVVQAYVGDPPGAGEPARQLKAFTKLSLAPGTTRRVSLPLDVRALPTGIPIGSDGSPIRPPTPSGSETRLAICRCGLLWRSPVRLSPGRQRPVRRLPLRARGRPTSPRPCHVRPMWSRPRSTERCPCSAPCRLYRRPKV